MLIMWLYNELDCYNRKLTSSEDYQLLQQAKSQLWEYNFAEGDGHRDPVPACQYTTSHGNKVTVTSKNLQEC